MYSYMEGIVTEVNVNSIVLEVSGIGYNIFVSNPYQFETGNKYKIYLYNYIREDENSLYGFKTKEEKELFLRLINVKGLGPKVASNFFATGSVSGIIDAIERQNIIYLTKFPKVGDKLARQIILDLKGKLVKTDENVNSNSELVSVLENLGYKTPDIKRVLPNIDVSAPLETQIKEALKLMLK